MNFKKILLVWIILLVSACGNQSIRSKQHYLGLESAQQNYQSHNYQIAADAYLQLFNQYGKQEFAYFVADSYLQMQQYLKAEQILNPLKLTDSPLQLLVLTELALFNQQTDSATAYMDRLKLTPTSKYYSRFLLLNSKWHQQNYRYFEAAIALIKLSKIDEINNYNEAIINFLSMVTEAKLTQELFNNHHGLYEQAWMEAAYVGYSNDPNAKAQWQLNWPEHPAVEFFLSTINYNKIAVLLPFSGRYQNISHSIQQGMIAAMYPNINPEQELVFFDTGSDGENFSNAWYQAMDFGAEFIIGPLEKKSIQQLKQLNSSTVPVLLLNEMDSEENHLGLFQFPLSPEDEAKNIAARLIAEDKKRVLLLAPESQMGRREAIAFEREFNFDDGLIVSHAFYQPSAHDYSNEMKRILGLVDSRQRIRRLERILGVEIKSETQVRPDIDAIVIFANAKQARLIKPQLKFFKAEDVPVYTTSQVFSGKIDAVLDKDLNGIKFSQSKFVTDPKSYLGEINFDTNNLNSNRKFFAFGYDAINLSSKIEKMQRQPQQKHEGLSGVLGIDSKAIIHRQLSWAQFRRGVPAVIADIVELPPESDASEVNEENLDAIDATEF